MAKTDILAGYMGILDFAGGKVRASSFSVNPEQTIQFYDHTIGLRDSIPASLFAGKGDTGFNNTPQKNLYRPSVIGITGTFSFPLSALGASRGFSLAKTGDEFTMSFTRDCENVIEYTRCRLSQYQLSLTAGDVGNVSCTALCMGLEEKGTFASYQDVEKLVTWDACSVTVPDVEGDRISSFNMTIANDCKYVYTGGVNVSSGLLPAKIRVGLQTVSGSVSFYSKGMDLAFMNSAAAKTITVSVSGLSFTIKCVYQPVKREGSVGPVISTLAYQGVGNFWEA